MSYLYWHLTPFIATQYSTVWVFALPPLVHVWLVFTSWLLWRALLWICTRICGTYILFLLAKYLEVEFLAHSIPLRSRIWGIARLLSKTATHFSLPAAVTRLKLPAALSTLVNLCLQFLAVLSVWPAWCVLWSEGLCPSRVHWLKSQPPCDGVRRWDAWEVTSSWGCGPPDGISALRNRPQWALSSLSAMWGHSEETPSMNQKAPSRHQIHQRLHLGLSASRAERWHLLFKPRKLWGSLMAAKLRECAMSCWSNHCCPHCGNIHTQEITLLLEQLLWASRFAGTQRAK